MFLFSPWNTMQPLQRMRQICSNMLTWNDLQGLLSERNKLQNRSSAYVKWTNKQKCGIKQKGYKHTYLWASPVAQRLKHLPGMPGTQVRSLDREDPLEKEMATYSSTLAWRIPWREEPGRLLVHGVAKSRTWLSGFTFTFLSWVSEVDYLQKWGQ